MTLTLWKQIWQRIYSHIQGLKGFQRTADRDPEAGNDDGPGLVEIPYFYLYWLGRLKYGKCNPPSNRAGKEPLSDCLRLLWFSAYKHEVSKHPSETSTG